MGEWLIIEAVCKVTTDPQTLAIARWAKMKKNGQARKHLDYYLSGKGGTLAVDLEKVLAEDAGVKRTIYNQIRKGLAEGKLHGKIPIPQTVYENQDWHYAIGGMNVNYHAGPPLKAGIAKLWFKNQYRWHPHDSRITQCVHQAAERLKSKGARDYWMEGETYLSLLFD